MSGGVPPSNLTGTANSSNQVALSWSIADRIVTPFTINGTFVNDLAATSIDIVAIGGGGGGACGIIQHSGPSPSGGGGAGGGVETVTGVSPSVIASTVAVTIGVGGSGATQGTNSPGQDGGTTTFGTYVTATGGQGGPGPGQGGNAHGGVGSTTLSGGVSGTGGDGASASVPGLPPANAPDTTTTPSGAGGGGANSDGAIPAPAGGSGGNVTSPGMAGGAGGASVSTNSGTVAQAHNGTAGQTNTAPGPGAGAGGGGFALLDAPASGNVIAGDGGNGGLYGGGGGGGGGGEGGIGGTVTGGAGGNGAQGLIIVTQHYTAPDRYNIYRNGVLIGTSFTTSYNDLLAPIGNDSYEVTAVYGTIESTPSNIVTLFVGGTQFVFGKFLPASVFRPILLGNLDGARPRIYAPIHSNKVTAQS